MVGPSRVVMSTWGLALCADPDHRVQFDQQVEAWNVHLIACIGGEGEGSGPGHLILFLSFL